MKTKAILAALALGAASAAAPVAAQPTWSSQDFWRGAPDGLQQRIDWLQQRIDRGRSDGSLDPEEARRAQWQLDSLRRDAQALQQRLDDLSRSIRWDRGDDDYGYRGGYRYGGRPYDRDDFATDYDASRYYRAEPGYAGRRLGPDDEVWRGSDGRYYCKRSDGTVGLVVGAVGGAAIGNVIDGGRNRVAGTLIGGALGALLGKTIDQNSDVNCR
jgi:hypothetical protein